jgi:thiosulfate dehydrogenase [quinone] large subunit
MGNNIVKSSWLSAETLGFLSLRAWLGVRALLTGIEKYTGVKTVTEPLLGADGNPDPSGAMVEFNQKVYGLGHYHAIPESFQTSFANQPLMPDFLMKPFCWLLGPLLIILGLMLLLGVKTRWSLAAQAALYVMLTAGFILINQDAGIAWLGTHVIMIALALKYEKYNRYTVTRS